MFQDGQECPHWGGDIWLNDFMEIKEPAMKISRGRAFQAKGTTYLKTSEQECA